jgi:hypothetical protein
MRIKVSKEWMATCGRSKMEPVFEVIKVDDYGSRGKMYTVKLEYGTWVVWSIRGVEELEDVA